MVAVQWAFLLSVADLAVRLITPLSLGFTLVLAGLLVAGMVVPGKRLAAAVLALQIARYLVIYSL
jgi:hypothetical protein